MKENEELKKLKEAVKAQENVLAPLEDTLHKESEKLERLKNKLERFRLENKMFYPLSRLAEFKDEASDILSIKFVQRTKNGKFKVEEMANDDLFFIII